MSVRAFIGIGSNLGDREAHCTEAAARLAALPQTSLRRLSALIETPPADDVAGGAFLNGVAEVSTELSPEQLLVHLQEIEAGLGRAPAHGPREARTIDLDLLLYADMTIRGPALTVPHPRMAQRRFVLEPLAAIAPEARHPVLGATAAELLRRLGKDSR